MKWSKKIENFLYNGSKTGINTAFVPLCGCAVAALKLLLEEGSTLCVTLPEAQSADRFHSDIAGLLQMLGIERKILTVPECGRGKLLFPGGEARRARALNRILNERFDLVIGSVHAFLGPAPCPQESESSLPPLPAASARPLSGCSPAALPPTAASSPAASTARPAGKKKSRILFLC